MTKMRRWMIDESIIDEARLVDLEKQWDEFVQKKSKALGMPISLF